MYTHKKGFIDQIMFWFFLIAMGMVFVGTVADQLKARSKYYNIDKITFNAARAAAKHYMYNGDMLSAQTIANGVVSQTPLGQELVSNNQLIYIWRDLNSNGLPDTVTAEIDGYIEDTFWYRLLDILSFNIPKTQASAYVNKEDSYIDSIAVRFGGSDAGYYNIIGTYELDENNCTINPKLLLVDKTLHNVGDELGSYTNLNTRYFIIQDGLRKSGWQNATLLSSITITGCFNDSPLNPSVTIDGVSNSSNGANIYFQDIQLNEDLYDHVREISKEDFSLYNDYVETANYRSSCSSYTNVCTAWEEVCSEWVDVCPSGEINICPTDWMNITDWYTYDEYCNNNIFRCVTTHQSCSLYNCYKSYKCGSWNNTESFCSSWNSGCVSCPEPYESTCTSTENSCTAYESQCTSCTTSYVSAGSNTWNDWVVHANCNNIDYQTDSNDEYMIGMEDLTYGGDEDFNDIMLDTTKVRIPNSIETSEIEGYTNVSP